MCLFQFWFPWGVCPAVELLGCMAILFPVFWGVSTLFSILAVLVCISTNSVRGFPFLHTLSGIYCLQTFWWQPFWLVWDGTSYLFFNWGIIALQYCVHFCHTSAWISHRYTYAPPLNLPPIPSHPSRLKPNALSHSSFFYSFTLCTFAKNVLIPLPHHRWL